MSTLEPSSTTVSDRLTDEYWRPLVGAVEQVSDARADDPSIPRHRLGRFELEELVGRGGMGIVFRAHDPRLDRIVALKLWNLEGDDAEQALLREAKLQAKVAHPNVVTIYETGKIGADVYLAMEYVRGMDARQWMREYEVSWQVVLAMFIHVGRGLAAVHERGLVHADFKPDNILVGTDGRVLVADFGVARVLGEHEHEPGVGSSGRGTRAYMAPERLERRRTDARSDQFSFCVALWECLHGVRPFAGDSVEELLGAMAVGQHQRGRVVPMELDAVLRRGLAPDADDRFAGMDELLRALIRVPMRIRPAGRAWARVGTWVLVGAMAAVGVMALLRSDREPGRAETPIIEKIRDHRINSVEPATTEETGPESDLPADAATSEIISMIEDHEFEPAFKRWKSERKERSVGGEATPQDWLTVARAFMEEASSLEAESPELALDAARQALKVAPIMLEDSGTPMAADAEEILLDAAAMVARLKDQD